MNWIKSLIVSVAMFATVIGCSHKASQPLTDELAISHIKAGALIVDVRTAQEFAQHHLPGVVNVPVDDLRGKIEQVAPKKDQVLLLHCRSGERSGKGVEVLTSMGYKNVFNLGSFARADHLIQTVVAEANPK